MTEISRKGLELVYLSNGEVRKQVAVPSLQHLIVKFGKNVLVHGVVWKNSVLNCDV